MDIFEPTIKMMTKQDFDTVKSNYEFTSEDAKEIVKRAKPLDVLVLSVRLGSGLKILGADVIKEKEEDTFLKIMKKGV